MSVHATAATHVRLSCFRFSWRFGRFAFTNDGSFVYINKVWKVMTLVQSYNRYRCNRLWKLIGLWDVEAPTFLRNRLVDGCKVIRTIKEIGNRIRDFPTFGTVLTAHDDEYNNTIVDFLECYASSCLYLKPCLWDRTLVRRYRLGLSIRYNSYFSTETNYGFRNVVLNKNEQEQSTLFYITYKFSLYLTGITIHLRCVARNSDH
jgi:hypothetical protein